MHEIYVEDFCVLSTWRLSAVVAYLSCKWFPTSEMTFRYVEK